jgi:hypothetical protein
MLRLLFFFGLLISFQSNAVSLDNWWRICGDNTKNESTCVLMIASIESGIRAQAIASWVNNNPVDFKKAKPSELTDWFGFCWSVSYQDSWALKNKKFNKYVLETHTEKDDSKDSFSYAYLTWFTAHYHKDLCKKI